MHHKFLIPALIMIWISLSPFPSRGDDVKEGGLKLTQPPPGSIQNKPTNPSSNFLRPSQVVTPENKNPDPEAQVPPAVKIQEGTDAEG